MMDDNHPSRRIDLRNLPNIGHVDPSFLPNLSPVTMQDLDEDFAQHLDEIAELADNNEYMIDLLEGEEDDTFLSGLLHPGGMNKSPHPVASLSAPRGSETGEPRLFQTLQNALAASQPVRKCRDTKQSACWLYIRRLDCIWDLQQGLLLTLVLAIHTGCSAAIHGGVDKVQQGWHAARCALGLARRSAGTSTATATATTTAAGCLLAAYDVRGFIDVF
jgi:hypothetical protein